MNSCVLATIGVVSSLIGWGSVHAQGEDSAKSNVTMLSSVKEFAPGKPFEVLLDLDHPKHWHSYYKNPATVGMPFEAKWILPEGFKVSEIECPVPSAGVAEGVVFYGYDHARYVFRVTPPANWPVGKVAKVTIQPTWQICSTGCIMEPENPDQTWSVELPAAANEIINEKTQEIFQKAQADLAQDLVSWKVSAYKDGNKYILNLNPEAGAQENLESAYFFGNENVIDPASAQKLIKTKNGYQLELVANTPENDMYPMPEKMPTNLSGVLTAKPGLLKDKKVAGLRIDVKIEDKSTASAGVSSETKNEEAPSSSNESFGELLSIIGLMFLGGMVLNLMPCVFPVIGLKVMGFVQMGGGERRKVVIHSLAFVVGVILSFWALTVILLTLKSTNPNINWADWFTYPSVVFGLLLLMLVLSLSMAGVFELGASATSIGGNLTNRHGYSSSFFSGILATLIATPCSGPFIGTAIALALKLNVTGMILAFTGMGLGMAFPYLILGIFPDLIRFLPKPGAWMETFKQSMSFLLFGAVAWLLYTYLASFENSQDQILNMLFGLVLISFATWIYGRWNLPWRSKLQRYLGVLAAAGIFAYGFYLSMPPSTNAASVATQNADSGKIDWQPWSEKTVQDALAKGQPVYIDFTARWCLTCQTNKKTAYTAEVRDILKKHNVLMLRADKTLANPAIDAEIKKLGRSAVPINVLWIPGDSDPKITREILTGDSYFPDFLRGHLEKK